MCDRFGFQKIFKLDGNIKTMFHAVLNKSWKQSPTK